jgi:glycerol kinase
MVTNEKFCQLLADFLELDIRVPASTESSATGAAITAGIGHGLFSSREELKQASRQLTVYTPRDGIRDLEDIKKWREFLQLLMQAYN